jgi:hypothetical protein
VPEVPGYVARPSVIITMVANLRIGVDVGG